MTTRRAFLQAMGRAGGYSAAYLSMQALGLLPVARAAAAPFALPPGSGTGRSVVVLGAGIAGLVAAYELGRAGYAVTVLEARDRVAGRVWTIRGGDRVVQNGRPDQMCLFDEGLYMNAGAARLPTHHTTILGYARDLGVGIEVMVNVNRSAGVDAGGQIVPERQAVNDSRGRIAELLAKSVDKGALDGELTGVDKARLRTFLTQWGALDPKGAYAGSERSGYATLPGGYGQAGKLMDPLTLEQIMVPGAWQEAALFEETFDQQAPMFQPVGGMDRIAHALYDRVKGSVRLSSPVKGMRPTERGVRVLLADGGMVEADYCLCAMPANQVAKLDAPFPAAKRAALKAAHYAGAAKVAWEAPRFWEADGIYGGIAWTDQPNGLVWYPSGRWNTDKGILMGAYAFGGFGAGQGDSEFVNMPFERRLAISKGVIERLHPGKSALLAKPVTVSWAETPYSEGIGAFWTEAQRKTDYVELAKPEGRIYFAGEHLSYIPFWQEGAALSAQAALGLLARRVADEKMVG